MILALAWARPAIAASCVLAGLRALIMRFHPNSRPASPTGIHFKRCGSSSRMSWRLQMRDVLEISEHLSQTLGRIHLHQRLRAMLRNFNVARHNFAHRAGVKLVLLQSDLPEK